MGISRASFYYEPREVKRRQSDFQVRDLIEKTHEIFPAYGYRRVYHHLLRQEIRINGKRIRRIMKEHSLYSCLKKMMKPRGANSSICLRHPNLIKGLKLTAPNQVWATDITYIKLRYEFIYLSAIIDIYTRKIVGWSVSKDLSYEFCFESLKVAMAKEKTSRRSDSPFRSWSAIHMRGLCKNSSRSQV